MPGRGKLILTGQLGDVMKESAQAALAGQVAGADLGIDVRLFKSDVHIHVPAGAIPKDGPSAGVAMFMALVRCSPGVRHAATGHDGEIRCAGWCCPSAA